MNRTLSVAAQKLYLRDCSTFVVPLLFFLCCADDQNFVFADKRSLLLQFAPLCCFQLSCRP